MRHLRVCFAPKEQSFVAHSVFAHALHGREAQS